MFINWHIVMLCLVTQLCHLCVPMDCSPPGSPAHGDSLGKDTGVSCHALLYGVLLAQGSNTGLTQCKRILYHLSQKGSSRILEWVAYSFSRGNSWSRNWTGVSCIAGGFFTSWATREANWHEILYFNFAQLSCFMSYIT